MKPIFLKRFKALSFLMCLLFVARAYGGSGLVCEDLLEPSHLNAELYEIRAQIDEQEMPADAKQRVEMREMLNRSLEPFYEQLSRLRTTLSSQEIRAWHASHPEPIMEVLGANIGGPLAPPEGDIPFNKEYDLKGRFSLDETLVAEADRKSFSSMHFDRVNQELLEKTAKALIYLGMAIEDNSQSFYRERSNEVLSYLTFAGISQSAILSEAQQSYLFAINFLSVRPNSPEYQKMSDLEWLQQLLLPQEGQEYSLVEKLAISTRPVFLATQMSELGVQEPLVQKDGVLLLSPQTKAVLHAMHQRYQNSHDPDDLTSGLGKGCPAAFCSKSREISGIREMSLTLLDVLEKMYTEEHGLEAE